MEVQWILVVHGLVTLLVVVSFLCGNWPIFQGTFVEKIHIFITFGAYDYFLRVIGYIFGSRGRNAILSVEYYCCDRPNPILQIMYLGIVGMTYYLIAKSSFKFIPGYYIGEYHRVTSMLGVGFALVLFLLTSFSDPGTINSENVSQYISLYPYDEIIYTQKECQTCKIPKYVVKVRIVFFVNLLYHHNSIFLTVCLKLDLLGQNTAAYVIGALLDLIITVDGWFVHVFCNYFTGNFANRGCYLGFSFLLTKLQNKCIGEKNTRYFMAFLFWHFCLCLYGVIALGLILASQLKEKKIIYILTVFYGVEDSYSSLFPHVVQWLLSSHNTQILMMVFLAIVSMLLFGFFAYHTHLCVKNTTTNETFKWQDYITWKTKLNEARASAAALRASMNAMDGDTKVSTSKWRRLFQRSPLQNLQPVVKNNIYDKGLIRNVLEIILPLSERSLFSQKKSD